MTEWKRKRFWTDVAVTAEEGGHTIRLDGRALRTPERALLVLPNARLADALAEEWRAVGEEILPDQMPFTRAANSAVDKVARQYAAVAEMVAAYGATDLLCYRADAPDALVAQQAAGWDPWLRWSEEALNAPLVAVAGVVPTPQPEASIAALNARVRDFDAFQLTALHDLVVHSGSLILGLAVAELALPPAEAWRLSRIDEDWQASQWGLDAEAEAAARLRERAFHDAARLLDLLRGA